MARTKRDQEAIKKAWKKFELELDLLNGESNEIQTYKHARSVYQAC